MALKINFIRKVRIYANYGNFCENSGGNHMPMIEAKVTMELPAEKRDVLKAEFGKAISIMN